VNHLKRFTLEVQLCAWRSVQAATKHNYHYRQYALLSVLNNVHGTKQNHVAWLTFQINVMVTKYKLNVNSLYTFLPSNTCP
jgi:hypothetical protein